MMIHSYFDSVLQEGVSAKLSKTIRSDQHYYQYLQSEADVM